MALLRHGFSAFISCSAFMKRYFYSFILVFWLNYGLPISHSVAVADVNLEYHVKAAFIYNFMAFTYWPESTNQTIQLCIYGENYFGNEIDKLQNKSVNKKLINVIHASELDQLKQCQAIFFSKSLSPHHLSRTLEGISNQPILTLADTATAISHGVTINMNLINDKIVFEVNLAIARKSGLDISSKLLQLATKVYQ